MNQQEIFLFIQQELDKKKYNKTMSTEIASALACVVSKTDIPSFQEAIIEDVNEILSHLIKEL